MRVVRWIVSIVALATPPLAAAQNPPPPPPRHEGTAEVAFIGVAGNASSNTFGLGHEMTARPATWTFRHRLAFVRNESGGALIAKSFLYAPRVEKAWHPRLAAFGEYGYFRDRFAGVSSRQAVTGGLSVKLAVGPRFNMTADAGAGYLNEQRITGDSVSGAMYATGAVCKIKLSETADISDELSLIGRFARSDDWRLTHAIALTARIAGGVSMKVSNGVRFSNVPAPGFKRTDAITSIALVAKFKRQ
jgi:putative salt-induced outer membrane protein